jgi:hypothetical protein
MSGYFARAIQQTGISIATASNSTGEIPRSPVIHVEKNDAITPVSLEEDILVDAPIEPTSEQLTVGDIVPPPEVLPESSTLEEKPNLQQPISTVFNVEDFNVEEVQAITNNIKARNYC